MNRHGISQNPTQEEVALLRQLRRGDDAQHRANIERQRTGTLIEENARLRAENAAIRAALSDTPPSTPGLRDQVVDLVWKARELDDPNAVVDDLVALAGGPRHGSDAPMTRTLHEMACGPGAIDDCRCPCHAVPSESDGLREAAQAALDAVESWLSSDPADPDDGLLSREMRTRLAALRAALRAALSDTSSAE